MSAERVDVPVALVFASLMQVHAEKSSAIPFDVAVRLLAVSGSKDVFQAHKSTDVLEQP